MLYMATGKPAHLGCKFLLDVSAVNNPIVVELLVITVLFCVVLPAGSALKNSKQIYHFCLHFKFSASTCDRFTTSGCNTNRYMS